MTTKVCAACGAENTSDSNFCNSCGAELSTAGEPVRMSAVRLSPGRLAVVCVLSGGLYYPYWFYLTWKHLDSETSERHHPVWHALTQVVPIYGLFRLHRHMSVIKELVLRSGGHTEFSPGVPVVLMLVIWGLNLASLRQADLPVTVMLAVLSTALTAVLVMWAQGSLNRYWENARSSSLQEARIGAGEVIFVLIGVVGWVVTFLPE